MEAAIKEKASYQRRTPENTLLYKVLQENLETFLELCRLDGKGMPKHVEEELKAFLRCGILQYGFLRLKCTSCEHESVCAFSCKKRGFCPSCNGKRMAETAEHLVENILPIAPYRQYVVAFPIPLRFWMATNKKLLAKIHKIVIDCLHCYLIDKAKSIGIKNAHPGSVTFIQRFGGSLNLHPHLHILVMDGVYTDHEKPRFAHLKSPTENEINNLIQTIAKKIIKHLRKKGYIKEEPDLVNNPYVDPLFADHPAWTNALAHSIENKIAFGENAGKYLRRIHSGFGYQEERPVVKSKLCSSINGFSVHANVSVNALQRQKLEKLIRYLARPSLSSERLSMNKKDEIIYELKNAWDDGTKFCLKRT